jgi:hypothetical protein
MKINGGLSKIFLKINEDRRGFDNFLDTVCTSLIGR